jgi:hypothetical protein
MPNKTLVMKRADLTAKAKSAKAKKVERGTLYLCGDADKVEIKPLDGKKFTTEELQKAVGGYFELMVPAVRHTLVYVNELGGVTPGYEPNNHTWKFADRKVYALNGYPSNWRVWGNALVVRKVTGDDLEKPTTYGFPTIEQFMERRK